MKVDVIPSGDVQVVALSGDFLAVDAATVRRICLELYEQGQRYLVIDFSDVEKVDGFSLASLISLMARLRKENGGLALVSVNPDLKKQFQKAYLDQVFPIFSTQAQAFEKLKS